MPFDPELEEDEEVVHEIYVKISKKKNFYLLLTNKAAYWVGKKKFAVKDDTIAIRLPVEGVDCISFYKSDFLWCLILGSLLVILGLLMIVASGFGTHLAWVAAGILIIFVGHKRRIVKISGGGKIFSWREPIYFGGGIKQKVDQSFSHIRNWAKQNKIRVLGSF